MSRRFTFVKDGVFYFSRRIPKELRGHCYHGSSRVMLPRDCGMPDLAAGLRQHRDVDMMANLETRRRRDCRDHHGRGIT